LAELVINQQKIIDNINNLNDFFKSKDIYWTLITKILSGNKVILDKILNNQAMDRLHSVGDSRLTNLRNIKQIRPDIKTMYIKPPPMNLVKSIVANTDISLNTSLKVIKAINKESEKIGKIHQIVIMIEMGELREGILRESIEEFYKQVFNLPFIEVIGIGTNLGCMYGIEPTFDKLIQLVLYKELLEAKFKTKLELVSGGSSITLPLLQLNKLPPNVNHFRIGEAAFVGTSPLDNQVFNNLHYNAFEFLGNIIEIENKDVVPDGVISNASIGHTSEYNESATKRKQAILDFGILDVDTDELKSKNEQIKFIGTTSDMSVYEVNDSKDKVYHIGDKIPFHPSYMGVARLMNSRFIEKRII